MNKAIVFMGSMLLLGIGACSDIVPNANLFKNQSSSVNHQATIPDQIKRIPTKPFNPQPIRITIDALPDPFATESASKPPQVMPIPENPTLKVPEGFTVNVFAEGLDSPRWLALTPSGDVLVTETRENRIRLLKDTNQDGGRELN